MWTVRAPGVCMWNRRVMSWRRTTTFITPTMNVYYSVSRHQYAYREGNAWVSRPAPRGVSVDVLLRSPSVKMDFHDSPANHHAAVVKQYPKNWKPSGANQGRKDNRKDDQHGDNNGR